MKLQSFRDGTKIIFLLIVLFGMLNLASCVVTPVVTPTVAPSEKFQFVVSIEDENGVPVRKTNVQLFLFANQPPLTAVTDDLGVCYFDIEKVHLKRLATIKVFWSGKSQPYSQTVALDAVRQTIQVKSDSPVNPPSFATPTEMNLTLEMTATETPTATKTLTPVPTATITSTSTPTSTPVIPASTPGVSAFTPYPASKDIIGPNTKNNLWQLATWRAESPVYSLSISPDGKLAASGEQNGNVIVRDLSTGAPLYTLNYGSAVLAVAFSPDGQWLAAAGSGRNILVWNAKTRNSPVEIGQHNGKVTSLSFSPDGTLLASSGYEDKAVKLWQVGGNWALNTVISVPEKVNAVVFSPDSRLIAVAANDIYPRVWDRNGTFQYALMDNVGPRQLITSLAFSPDSAVLVTGTRDLERCLQVWDTKARKLERGIGGNLQIEAIAFSPDGELLVTSNDKFELTVWRASNMSELRLLKNYHQDLIYSIVFSPDGKLMLTASRDKTIRVWGIR